MDNQKIKELKYLLTLFKIQSTQTTLSFRIDEKYKAIIVHVDSRKDLIQIMNLMGAIGAFFNMQVDVTNPPHYRYRISIINFDKDWKKQRTLYP